MPTGICQSSIRGESEDTGAYYLKQAGIVGFCVLGISVEMLLSRMYPI